MRRRWIRTLLVLALAVAVPACGGGGGGGGGGGPAAVPVVLVSASAAGTAGNADSTTPSVSSDGRYVAFASTATNLTGTATTAFRSHIYLKDMQSGAVTLISRPTGSTPGTEGDGSSSNPVISADGRYIAFASSSRNLVTSVAAITNGAGGPYINVFLHDTQGPTTTLISNSTASATQEGNGHSGSPAITVTSVPSVQVAFESSASDLVTTDTNGFSDVFLKPQGQATQRVSLNSAGTDTGNNASTQPSISEDGDLIAFQSLATDLIATADGNTFSDVFVRKISTSTTTRVSLTDGDAPITGAGAGSTAPMISGNGSHVVFVSTGNNLGDPFGIQNDIYIRINWADASPTNQVTQHVSLHPSFGSGEGCSNPVVNADGTLVIWHSPATLLVNGDTNLIRDVFRSDRSGPTPVLDRVSLSNTGAETTGGIGTISRPSMSTGGTYIVFDSNATNVVSPATSVRHIYRRG